MKKNAFITLAKDAIIAFAAWGLTALILNGLFPSIGWEGARMFAIYFAGLPFGWRIASNIISAVSLKGLGIKFLIEGHLRLGDGGDQPIVQVYIGIFGNAARKDDAAVFDSGDHDNSSLR